MNEHTISHPLDPNPMMPQLLVVYSALITASVIILLLYRSWLKKQYPDQR